MRILLFLFVSLFSLKGTQLFSQLYPPTQGGPYIEVDSTSHTCDSLSNGYIGLNLQGNPEEFYYYWTDGSTDLVRDSLPDGDYTFIVRNLFGCEEEYDFEIQDITNCTFTYTVTNYSARCEADIAIQVFVDGNPVSEDAVAIVWDDGNNAGLTRRVETDTGNSTDCYGFLIDVSKCCVIEDTICVNAPPQCYTYPDLIPWDGTIKEVIVNEIRRLESDSAQFIELLVLGTGVCEDTFDMRGFIVDDNNGYLIRGKSTIIFGEMDLLGYDEGYLIFSNVPSWEKVPNGSLIVLYGDRSELEQGFPTDDPEDSNGDGVYVLSIEDTDYFMSRQGQWLGYRRMITYSGGSLQYPSWSQLNINEEADGIQVRYPDGSFSHGISSGISSMMSTDTFEVWLGDTLMSGKNYQFTGTDYFDPADFTHELSSDSLYTPGVANSTENAAIIEYLRDCNSSQFAAPVNGAMIRNEENESEKSEKNTLQVSPNPFYKDLYLKIEAFEPGKAKINLYNMSGSLIQNQELMLQKGGQTLKLETHGKLPSGLLLVEVLFPSGERLYAKVASIY